MNRSFTIALAHTVGPEVTDGAIAEWWANKGRPEHAAARLCSIVSPYPTHAVLIETAESDGEGMSSAVGEIFSGAEDLLTPSASIVGREIFAAGEPDARQALDGIPVGAHLYMPQLNVDPEIEADFNDWYNDVHVPMVEPAGLRQARRYLSSAGIHKYFARYVMDDADVLSSDAIQAVRGFDHFTGRVFDLTRLVARVLA